MNRHRLRNDEAIDPSAGAGKRLEAAGSASSSGRRLVSHADSLEKAHQKIEELQQSFDHVLHRFQEHQEDRQRFICQLEDAEKGVSFAREEAAKAMEEAVIANKKSERLDQLLDSFERKASALRNAEHRNADPPPSTTGEDSPAMQLMWQAVRDVNERMLREAESRASLQRELLSVLGQGVQQLRSEQAQQAVDIDERLRSEQQRVKKWESEAEARQCEQEKRCEEHFRRVNELDAKLQLLTRSVMEGGAPTALGSSIDSKGVSTPRLDSSEAHHLLDAYAAGRYSPSATSTARAFTPRGSRAGALGHLRGQLESLRSELAASSSTPSIAHSQVQSVLPPVVRWVSPTPPAAVHTSQTATQQYSSQHATTAYPTPQPATQAYEPQHQIAHAYQPPQLAQTYQPQQQSVQAYELQQPPVIQKPTVLVASHVVTSQPFTAGAATPGGSTPATPSMGGRVIGGRVGTSTPPLAAASLGTDQTTVGWPPAVQQSSLPRVSSSSLLHNRRTIPVSPSSVDRTHDVVSVWA